MPDSRSSASEFSRTSVSINSSSDEDDGPESEISVFSVNGRETRPTGNLIRPNANQLCKQVNAINSTVSIGPHINTHGSGNVTIQNYFGGTEIAPEALQSIIHNSIPDNSNRNEIRDSQARFTATTDVREQLPQTPASFWERNRWYLVCGTAVIIITASIIITVAIVSTSGKDDDPPNPNNTLANGKRIFTKGEWGGRRPRDVTELPHPTPYVVISHTATDMCNAFKLCADQLRSIQDYHVGEFYMTDIGHNFLVGPDGNVYEGRGWDATNMHTGFVWQKNLGVGLFGNFQNDEPTAIQIESTQQLLDLGVKLQKLDPNYYIFSHNYTMDTASPGRNLYRIISTWEHFRIPNSTLMNSNS